VLEQCSAGLAHVPDLVAAARQLQQFLDLGRGSAK